MTKRKRLRPTPAALHLYQFGLSLIEVSEELECHPSYVSHQLAGQDPYSERLHDTLVERIGTNGADTVRALADTRRKQLKEEQEVAS